MTQGDTLSVIDYVIRILSLIYELHISHTHIMQSWYADDAGAGGKFLALQAHMRDLMVRVPPRVYFPKPTKSILVISPRNVPREDSYLRVVGVSVFTRSRYLDGFIGDPDAEKYWVAYKVKWWTDLVEVMSGVARQHQQSAYADLQKSLQQEWAFIQRIDPGIGEDFCTFKKSLQHYFLLAPFCGTTAKVPSWVFTRLLFN